MRRARTDAVASRGSNLSQVHRWPISGGLSPLQREEPVAAGGRTHGKRHQADLQCSEPRWPERPLYEVYLTPGCDWAVQLLERLLPRRANTRSTDPEATSAALNSSPWSGQSDPCPALSREAGKTSMPDRRRSSEPQRPGAATSNRSPGGAVPRRCQSQP